MGDEAFEEKQRELQQLTPSELELELEARVVSEAPVEKRSEVQRSGECERGKEVGDVVRQGILETFCQKRIIYRPPEGTSAPIMDSKQNAERPS